MKLILIKIVLCLLPLLLTPIWGYLIAGGHLNFGAGEKDLFLLIPWLFWSSMYLVIFIVFWVKRKKIKVLLLNSIGGATMIFIMAWIVLFIFSNNILGIYKGT